MTGPRTLGAYRLATELRKYNYDVEVIDYLSFWKPQELLDYIDAGPKPLWIGFSSTFMGPGKQEYKPGQRVYHDKITRFDDDWGFWEEIKKRSPIVIGGSKAERMKWIYDADWIVNGYADIAIIALSDYISGKNNDLKFTTETIGTLYNKRISYECKSINCQESYPVNDVTDIQTRFHETDFIQPNEVLPLEISRGCIFKCSFCAFPLNGKTKNDYVRPKEQIAEDIKLYQEQYKSNRYFFMDDTFNDTVEKMRMMKEVHDEVGPFDFWAYGRLDLIASKPEMMDLVGQIGWKYFSFGVETFNRNAGKKIGKGADPNKLKECLKEFKEKNPDSHILFEMIIGLPGETEESVHEAKQWFLDNSDLWEEVHFKSLSIDNQKFNVWKSEMSLNPEKFGIKIVNFKENNSGLRWEHESMSSSKANEISKSVTEQLDQFRPRVKSTYFIKLSDTEVLESDTADMARNKFRQEILNKGQTYINLKIKHRGLK